ncbi:hypothetical protein SSX86_000181 [Deinandra increscens subsp. villosa]|uniref:Uncharacterized protein n=1 Tax=Deinandra increscens subsp. villosa TaxID=3103831 RepID=A0AAP0E0E0_9ASTR
MAEEEERIDDILHPNTLIAWERIQLPSLPTQFQSQSPVTVLSDPHGGERIWSTQLAHKHHRTSVVFPPTDHEGLNLQHQFDEVLEKCEERAKPQVPVATELKPAAIGAPVEVKLGFFRFRLPGILSCIWNCSLRSFNLTTIGSIVLLFLFCLRFRLRRRRLRAEAVDELLGVIKEKDERIGHLLHQIARMNELLLASHHGVPLISKAAKST